MIPCQGSSTRPAPLGPKRERGGTPHRSPRRPLSGRFPPPPFPRWACGPRPGVRGECRRKRNCYKQAGRPCDRPVLTQNPERLSLQTIQDHFLKSPTVDFHPNHPKKNAPAQSANPKLPVAEKNLRYAPRLGSPPQRGAPPKAVRGTLSPHTQPPTTKHTHPSCSPKEEDTQAARHGGHTKRRQIPRPFGKWIRRALLTGCQTKEHPTCSPRTRIRAPHFPNGQSRGFVQSESGRMLFRFLFRAEKGSAGLSRGA